ncbi:MAG TPA: T9SS type A sorting domain-containing protein [Chitinophagaceae bacterium]|nr:T9SS type A sorting domain-containing protein [Chitinophagaceae bacterium]
MRKECQKIKLILLILLIGSDSRGFALPPGSLKSSSCNASGLTSTWTGLLSTNWTNSLNWTIGVPGSLIPNALIPSGCARYPVISSGTVSVSDITIQSNASVTVSSNGIVQIGGAISNSGTFNVTDGTIEMNGASSQAIPANTFYNNAIKNLIISNTSAAGVSLGGTLNLYGTLSFGNVNNSIFATGGYLTLSSNASGTALVADMTNSGANSGNQITGSVTVERYFAAQKKWRFLSIPTSTTQTIQSAWQEGCGANVNCVPGYGTQLTGPGGTSAGFDMYTASPSIKTYNQSTNSWVAVPGTTAYSINTLSNNTVSYCIFIRGDRSCTSPSDAATSTTLRTKGVIKQGSQSAITVASPATSFTMIGNPYPAMIDLRKMTPPPTTSTRIYVWDPYLYGIYGYGGYQTLTYNGSTFTATPGGGIYGSPYNLNANYIESGQAFIVGGTSSAYSITFKENIKASGSGAPLIPYKEPDLFRINLLSVAGDTATLVDGVMVESDSAFSDSVDDNDAYKLFAENESVSIARDNAFLSVERYGAITAKDTFNLNIRNLNEQEYQLRVDLAEIHLNALQCFLWDNFLQQATSLNLNELNRINFEVTNDPKSHVAGRFKIYFTPVSVLEVAFTSCNAYRYNDGVIVKWHAEVTPSSAAYFIVEKSNDGIVFNSADTLDADRGAEQDYAWLDKNPDQGNNYYRIKSIGADKKINYSRVMNVFIPASGKSIAIYPNPADKNNIQLKINGLSSGWYRMAILNVKGQIIFSEKIYYEAGAAIGLSRKLNAGIYEVELVNSKNELYSCKWIYQ